MAIMDNIINMTIVMDYSIMGLVIKIEHCIGCSIIIVNSDLIASTVFISPNFFIKSKQNK